MSQNSNAETMLAQLANPDTKAMIERQASPSADIRKQLSDPNFRAMLDSGVALAADWVTGTVYAAGAVVKPLTGNTGGYYFRTPGGGNSGNSEPSPWSQTVGGVSTDGTIADWTNIGALPYFV
jgi:hypothetical protein